MPPELEQEYDHGSGPAASDTVREVAAEVLETMFFTEAEVGELRAQLAAVSAPCARIRFEGSHCGEMLLGVSAEAADPIAASFLGLDPMELTDAQRGQVIQELSNILCGAMLSRLWPESKLALGSPELTPGKSGPGRERCTAASRFPKGCWRYRFA